MPTPLPYASPNKPPHRKRRILLWILGIAVILIIAAIIAIYFIVQHALYFPS